MRVQCRAIDGYDIEGEVIGGEVFDPLSAGCDLESIFTVRCDDPRMCQSLPQSQNWRTEP